VRAIWMGPALLVCFGLQACDAAFDPFQEPARMSVYGALDASADTQWIRVTPARHTLLTSPDPLGSTVTLERVGTGTTVQLRDSIVAFTTIGGLYPEAMWYTHNYWTTEPIEPGATYTVTVTGTDRATATVTDLPIPRDYSVVFTYPFGARASVRVDSVPYLGLFLYRLYFDPDCAAQEGLPDPMVFHANIPPPVSPGVYEIDGDHFPPGPSLPPPCPIIKRDFLFVASGSPWPKGLQYVPSALGVLSTASDVENGVGFLGGVLTKSIQPVGCTLEADTHDPCVLTYDSTSVTLKGSVQDALTGDPLRGSQIHLTEILPDSSPPTKLRGSTNDQGSFEFGAVEAGVRHVYRVSHPAICNHFVSDHYAPIFLDHVDTLPAYAPAEHATADDVALQRNPDCDGYYVLTGW